MRAGRMPTAAVLVTGLATLGAAAPASAAPAGTDGQTWSAACSFSFLFAHRVKHMAKTYINTAVIPSPCRKAGVPTADVRPGNSWPTLDLSGPTTSPSTCAATST